MSKINLFDKTTIKTVNKQNVFNVFKGKEKVSVAQIIDETGLTAVTIANTIKELIDEDKIKESHLGKSSGGRKPKIYSLNANRNFLILFALSKKKISLVLTNLNNDIIIDVTEEIMIQSNEQLAGTLNRLIDDNLSSDLLDQVIAISVNTPGIIDYHNQILIYSAPLAIKEFDFNNCFSQKALDNLPLYLFKDVDSLLMGSVSEQKSKIAYLYCEDGLGFSIFSDDVLIAQTSGALELGHTYCCIDNQQQKVGDFFKDKRLIAKYNQFMPVSNQLTSRKELVNELKNGTDCATTISKEIINVLIFLSVNIVNMFAPDLIIIGGGVTESLDIDLIEKGVKEGSLTPFGQELKMRHAKATKELGFLGTSKYILAELVFKTIEL